MKNSGIPWMGKIPSNWRIGKVKHFYRFITGFTPDSKNESFYDENGTPWVTISDMDGKYVVGTKNGISPNYVSAKNPTLVPSNSLLYSFKLSVGQVARTTFDVYTNEAIASFLPLDNISLDYLFYSSQVCIIENANENIYGAKLLNQDLINNATILFPPLEEQQKIASFLDRKCSEIDEMIALQETIIEELKAYKQSAITEVVTKGLDPNVEMKDSGIEWIGKIPEGWRVSRLKNVANRRVEKSEDLNLKYIGLEHLVGFSEEMVVTENVYDSDGTNVCYEGDVIFGKLRPYLGKAKVIKEHCCCSTEFLVLKDNDCPTYLRYLMLSEWFIEIVNASTYGTKMPRANADFILNISVPVPSVNEQKAISNYLDKKCSEIDSLISTKNSKIEELKEYKKSIIYEYTTGKKEING